MLTNLSDETFEQFLLLASVQNTINLGNITFIDPFGMVGVLETGRYYKSMNAARNMVLPNSSHVLKYLERMDFFKHCRRFFSIQPETQAISGRYLRKKFSDVLLEITPIEKSDDIHFIVSKVKKRAHNILSSHLHYDENRINGFIVSLSEVCQNIIEHSENTGFVGIQKYHFQKYKMNVVKIAVMDLGIGFSGSLSDRVSLIGDLEAIEMALLQGVSRHSDEGRGHGLAAVRKFVQNWNGKISIRSGTAKVSIIPSWSWGKSREQDLIHFPGAQINIMLPEV
ncbi:MAG: sensor histidine kinase [Nitrospiraceae bacterium]|nr:MAG: sensor histidine kinase [Nitrospiraceae bacterium]